MNEPIEIQIITPPVASSDIENDLVSLTEHIWRTNHAGETYGYGLGGEYGYGVEYENDVFSMFPFYWGDCECGYEQVAEDFWRDNDHAVECWQRRWSIEHRRLAALKLPWADEERKLDEWAATNGWDGRPGVAVFCDCGTDAAFAKWHETHRHAPTCGVVKPNFLHKRSGLRIDWYKWIGRDTEYSPAEPDPEAWRAIFAECVSSVRQ